MILKDSQGRVHDYLRISLTEKCNLRCTYCMPEHGIQLRNKSHFMTPEEVIQMAQTFVDLGIRKIRLTGGEPLIYKGFEQVVKALSAMPVELSITTNGVLLHKYFEVLKNCSVNTINVSLDTLNTTTFETLTRRNDFQQVVENYQRAIELGFQVKLNVVLIKGVNDHEIVDFIDLTKNTLIAVRFIEFMPFDDNQWNWEKVVSEKQGLEVIKDSIQKEELEKLDDGENIMREITD